MNDSFIYIFIRYIYSIYYIPPPPKLERQFKRFTFTENQQLSPNVVEGNEISPTYDPNLFPKEDLDLLLSFCEN
jgi:hypothetical protein